MSYSCLWPDRSLVGCNAVSEPLHSLAWDFPGFEKSIPHRISLVRRGIPPSKEGEGEEVANPHIGENSLIVRQHGPHYVLIKP